MGELTRATFLGCAFQGQWEVGVTERASVKNGKRQNPSESSGICRNRKTSIIGSAKAKIDVGQTDRQNHPLGVKSKAPLEKKLKKGGDLSRNSGRKRLPSGWPQSIPLRDATAKAYPTKLASRRKQGGTIMLSWTSLASDPDPISNKITNNKTQHHTL